MIILDVDTWYNLFGLDWIVKKEKCTCTLKIFSHALDPFEFGAWQQQHQQGSKLQIWH